MLPSSESITPGHGSAGFATTRWSVVCAANQGAAPAARRAALETRSDESPEQAYERAWALAVLERATERLRAEQARMGRERVHDTLYPALADDAQALPHRALAAGLGLSESAVKVAVHRLRKRLGELVRDEVLQTLDDSRELADELGRLHRALSGS